MQTQHQQYEKRPKMPRGVWMLGFVSLFMDTASELIHSLLPLFMVATLGSSMTAVGVVEGLAEATALIVKVFSGTFSDYVQKRKLLTLIGYGLAAITKLVFPLAQSMGVVLFARCMDRVGKGIRGAPRDAMLSDIAPPAIRGACFGLHQALDTVGAFLGPLLAMVGMLFFADNIRTVLWIAVVPAFIAVIILVVGVKEPPVSQDTRLKKPIHFRDIFQVGAAYWKVVGVAGLFMLARFSEAFLLLKAHVIGLPMTFVPLVMVLMNIIYAGMSYPAGVLSDRVSRKSVLVLGIVFLMAADLILGLAANVWMLGVGISLWALHMAFTQGVLATLVTDTTPSALRGTAYGILSFVSGIAVLLSSVIAGVLWDGFGPAVTFFTGAGCTVLALLGVLLVL